MHVAARLVLAAIDPERRGLPSGTGTRLRHAVSAALVGDLVLRGLVRTRVTTGTLGLRSHLHLERAVGRDPVDPLVALSLETLRVVGPLAEDVMEALSPPRRGWSATVEVLVEAGLLGIVEERSRLRPSGRRRFEVRDEQARRHVLADVRAAALAPRPSPSDELLVELLDAANVLRSLLDAGPRRQLARSRRDGGRWSPELVAPMAVLGGYPDRAEPPAD